MRMTGESMHLRRQLGALGRRVLKAPWLPVAARWAYSGERQRASLWDCLTALPLLTGHVRPTVQVIAIRPERDEVLVLDASEFPGQCTLIQGLCRDADDPRPDAIRELAEEAIAQGGPDPDQLRPARRYREGIWGQFLAQVYVWTIDASATKPVLRGVTHEGSARWLPRGRVQDAFHDPRSATLVQDAFDRRAATAC